MAVTVLLGPPRSGKSSLARGIMSPKLLMHLILASDPANQTSLRHLRHRNISCDLYQECMNPTNTLNRFGSYYDIVLIDGLNAWIVSMLALKLNVLSKIDELCASIVSLKKAIIVSSHIPNTISPMLSSLVRYANRSLAIKARRIYMSEYTFPIRLK
ncbi:MAG: bifunctional adenosylcobinamide kinase/adenosylcobinamide-phosphate guanylyltransferase [Candidatus Hodgkinia cicadicola]